MVGRFTVVAAVMAVSLGFASACPASEVQASVPETAYVANASDVVDRAVRALVVREGEARITRLWVFPTGDPNAVFVHYRTVPDTHAHEPGPTTEHLVLLEMNGERIAKVRDLTKAPASLVAAVGDDLH